MRPKGFAERTIALIAQRTGLPFREARNHFEAQAAKDAVSFLSGALKTCAVALTKIANDIRWLGSGPRGGLGEIRLPELQPGSSIMPGKVNPVIAESLLMICAQVIGHDAAITWGCAAGNFELNVMMPVMAYDLLDSIELLSAGVRNFALRCVNGIEANREKTGALVEQSLAMATALTPGDRLRPGGGDRQGSVRNRPHGSRSGDRKERALRSRRSRSCCASIRCKLARSGGSMKPMAKVFSSLLIVALGSLSAARMAAQDPHAAFNKPFPPFKVMDNIYFVGTEELGSFLITTPAGHILINSDFETTVPQIRAAVEKLGFKFTDIKILLGSHAHGDHMEGDALVKELTGAQVVVMDQDVPALSRMTPQGKPHPMDRVIHDGEEVKLGGVTLVAHLTPGHTKGCTTWTLKAQDDGKTYNVVILGSIGVNPGYILVNNKDYPQIADDYVRGFKVLRALPCDVFLASHSRFYGMPEKYAKMKDGGANPFIDPAGYRAHLDLQEKNFKEKLAEQQQQRSSKVEVAGTSGSSRRWWRRKPAARCGNGDA